MSQPTLISLGSINMDIQMRTDRWPNPGETLLGDEFLMTAGGKAANVAVLGRRLEAEVRLIGHVGDDRLADIALDHLQRNDIDLQRVTRVSGEATAVSTIVVRPDGEKVIMLAPNANLAWNDQEDADTVVDAIECAPDGSVLVVDLEIPASIVQRAMETARDRSYPVILDPSPADRFTDALGPLTSVLVPNPAEASQLTGVNVDSTAAAERAGRMLLERGIDVVCQKLGDGGCVVISQDAVDHVPAVTVDVVDKTGAGDAFAGGMGIALLAGASHIEAATMAVAASHLAVSGWGSQQSYPNRVALDRMASRIAEAHTSRSRDT